MKKTAARGVFLVSEVDMWESADSTSSELPAIIGAHCELTEWANYAISALFCPDTSFSLLFYPFPCPFPFLLASGLSGMECHVVL